MTTMNAQEQLSALLDGELPDAEVAMAVRRVARDDELRSTALRYSLIGDALRDELPRGRPADLVARVRLALENDAAPVDVDRAPVRNRRVARYAGGFAVAASVAIVALVALPGRQQETPPLLLSTTEVASPGPEQRMSIQPAFTRPAGGGPDRLTRYYVNHTEYAPPMSGRGALTRIIVILPESSSVDEERPEAEQDVLEETGTAR